MYIDRLAKCWTACQKQKVAGKKGEFIIARHYIKLSLISKFIYIRERERVELSELAGKTCWRVHDNKYW